MSDAYPWLLLLGALAGLLWLGLVEPVSKRQKSSFPSIARIDAGLAALILGLLSARLGYVLVHKSYYFDHLDEILRIWNGGLSWIGGVIGAYLGLGLYAAFTRRPFWLVADTVTIPSIFLAFTAWFGCLLDGCAHGKPANYGLLSPPSEDLFGNQINRWPVQGTGAILTLGIFAILNKVRLDQAPQGVLSCLGLSLISASNLLLTFLRGDQVPVLSGFRLDAIASATLLIIGLICLAFRLKIGDEIET